MSVYRMPKKADKKRAKLVKKLELEMLDAIAAVMNAAAPAWPAYPNIIHNKKLKDALHRLNKVRLRQHDAGVYLQLACEESEHPPVGGEPYPTVPRAR